MTYTPQTWNDADPTTPLTAARLDHIEAGVDDADTRATALEATVDGLDTHFALRGSGPLTIVLGDSIDQGSDLEDYYSAGSIFSQLCVDSSQKVKWLRNSGIAGNTTTAVLARVQDDVVAHSPGICIFGGGVTNDHGAGVDPATTKANLTAIADALVAAGIRPVARLCPPCDEFGGGDFDTIDARRAAIQRHNTWLTAWANGRGIPVLDYYSPLVDETTGGYITAYTDDGTHPSLVGQAAVAAYLIAAGLPPLFDGVPLLTSAVGDAADLLAGVGLNLGTPSEGVAGGWSHYGNDATLAVVSAAFPGNWQTVTGGTDSIHVIESSAITDGFTVGDVLEFAARVDKAGLGDSSIRLQFFDGDGQIAQIAPCQSTRVMQGVAGGRLAVPSGTVQLVVQAVVAGGETFKFGQVTVSNLTELDVA